MDTTAMCSRTGRAPRPALLQQRGGAEVRSGQGVAGSSHGLAPESQRCKRLETTLTKAAMPKLSEYVEMAANEYLQETGKDELDARWIAEFFQDGGVQDDYPRQDLVAFSDLV
jgi:hypothetical protein